jgi:hypothetical protein
MRFALRIGFQALRAAAAQRIVQNKIERKQIRHFVTLDGAFADGMKMLLHPRRRQMLPQPFVDFVRVRDNAHIARVAFVAAARVSDFNEKYSFHVNI